MEKERKQSLLYGMGKELVLCPICEGEKMVGKISFNGAICYYKDGTVINEPCKFCNGNGIVSKHKRGKL